MNRPLLSLGVAAAALLALSGCTTAAAPTPAASPSATATATAAALTCPTSDEVAGLTALPFTATTGTDGGCAYTAVADGGDAALAIARRAPAVGRTTLTGFRYQQIEQGRTTTDATALSFDAFTVRDGSSCSAWLTAADGVVTTVTATRAGASADAVCDLARSAAVLVQGGTAAGSAPIVSVIAPEGLLGADARTTALAARLGSVADARVGLLASGGAGFSVRDGERALASQVQPRADAVVLIAGTADAGRDRLTVLKAASAALSQAGGTAPDARLIVVGPLQDGSASAADVLELRDTLATAARIADATFIDPIAEGWGTTAAPVSRAEADRIARSLADEVAAAIG